MKQEPSVFVYLNTVNEIDKDTIASENDAWWNMVDPLSILALNPMYYSTSHLKR